MALTEEVGDLTPFWYPPSQFIDRFERIRFVAAGISQSIREPRGTSLLFQKTTQVAGGPGQN